MNSVTWPARRPCPGDTDTVTLPGGQDLKRVLVALVLVGLFLAGSPALAGPAEQLVVFRAGGNSTGCGVGSGRVGTSYFGAPHPSPGDKSRRTVACKSARSATVRTSTLESKLSAQGAGLSTEVTTSYANSYLSGVYRITKPVDSLALEVTVAVEQAAVEVPSAARATTNAAAFAVFNVFHTRCEACSGRDVVVMADSYPTTDAPESAMPGTYKLQVALFNPDGVLPKGDVLLSVVDATLVLTDTFATPVEAQGSASIRMKVTKAVVRSP